MVLLEERVGAAALLTPRGRVDSTTAPMLGERLDGVFGGAPVGAVVLDLSGLEYISSAGFRVLLVANRQARSSGVPLHLCGLSDKLQQLFDLAGFLGLFTIHAQRADAVAAAAADESGANA
ncbi:MAG: STAS domain-containing protein [Burkholderiaceae bacterium]|nr:STAS domain-containing protein [Burkholderiaceae bacterium]